MTELIELQELLPGFWQREAVRLQAVILPQVEGMAIAGADIGTAKMASVGIFFDNAQAHAAAAAWARQFVDSFLRDEFNITTQKSVGAVLANWLETPGATLDDLDQALRPILDNNEARARAFATTESTRAFSKGETESYIEAGLPPVVIQPPDGDVNCRCWPTPVQFPNREWVIVWQTSHDVHVRTDPKQVPWGTVAGHKGLHNVVISQGPYLGMKLSEARAMARQTMPG